MFLDDLVTVLTENGLGTYGVDIFKGSKAILPAGSGPYITVQATGGAGESGTHNLSPTTTAYERPSAQVVCRATDYEDASARALAAQLALNFVNRFVGGTWWLKCGPKQEPFDLPEDEKGRAVIAFNVSCEKRLSPATS